MIEWISEQCEMFWLIWKTPVSTGKILFAHIHRAWETQSVKLMLQKKETILINVSSSITSWIQPLDVYRKIPFKCYIREQFEKQVQENMNF